MQTQALYGTTPARFTSNIQARSIYVGDENQLLPRTTMDDFWDAVEEANEAFGAVIPHAFKGKVKKGPMGEEISFEAHKTDYIVIVVAKGFYLHALEKVRALEEEHERKERRKVVFIVKEASSDIFPGTSSFVMKRGDKKITIEITAFD
ncbi:hypothetical protein H0H93_012227 [Arthromyces matolae]|nr:hypothetical protein H0H93_012227 [Arthromyces matolae]